MTFSANSAYYAYSANSAYYAYSENSANSAYFVKASTVSELVKHRKESSSSDSFGRLLWKAGQYLREDKERFDTFTRLEESAHRNLVSINTFANTKH